MNTGGLAVRSFARAVLVESTIADCTAPVSGGGGICASDHANITLQDGSRVERCFAQSYGGGLQVYEGSHLELLQSSIHDCSARWAGGIYVNTAASMQMMQSSILNCSASLARGGCWIAAGSTLLATNCVRAPRLELTHTRRRCTHAPVPVACLTHQGRVSSLRHAAYRPSNAARRRMLSADWLCLRLQVWPGWSTAASCGATPVPLAKVAR